MRRLVAATAAVGLLLAACSDGEPDVGFDGLPEQTESPTAEPTPTSAVETEAAIDVTTTPDEITPEWVSGVVNTLLAEYGEMTAEVLAMPVQDDPTLPDGFADRLDALFDGQYLEFAESELAALLVNAEDRRAVLKDPTDYTGLTFTTEKVQVATGECIVAVGRVNRAGTRRDEQTGLSLAAVAMAPSDGAPAAWEVRDLLANTDPDGRPNDDSVMLEATLSDYGTSLDHTCGEPAS